MKRYLGLMLLVFLFSCKTTKAVLTEGKAEDVLSAENIIKNYSQNKADFKTLYIKATAKYKDEKQSQNITAEIKIKKDEIILVSVRFLGITMAKALITPKEVKYYEKIDGTYFEGNYQALSQWLGTDLDFAKVQNMLIGRAIDDLNKGKFKSSIQEDMFKLQHSAQNNTDKNFFFESKRFLLKRQEINQPDSDRKLEVYYPNFQEYPEAILPSNVMIMAIQKKKWTTIVIDYNSVSFNEEVSFPYSVPDGYERIFIN
jgi:hypothetical protein